MLTHELPCRMNFLFLIKLSALFDFKTENFDIFPMKKIINTKFSNYSVNYFFSFKAKKISSLYFC